VGSALQAKVVMAKLFPKLVSSLAVLLLLCQFGYVACQSTDFSDRSLFPEDEGAQDILFHLHIYPFPTIYKRRKKICLSVNYELFLQYLLPIQADPLLFQILNSNKLRHYVFSIPTRA